MGRGTNAAAVSDILYGATAPRKKTLNPFTPHEIDLDSGWFEGWSGWPGYFSGTDYWVAKTDSLDGLGIDLKTIAEFEMDSIDDLAEAPFLMISKLSEPKQEILKSSVECDLADGDQPDLSIGVYADQEQFEYPRVNARAIAAVEQLVETNKGRWLYNPGEQLFIYILGDQILGACRGYLE